MSMVVGTAGFRILETEHLTEQRYEGRGQTVVCALRSLPSALSGVHRATVSLARAPVRVRPEAPRASGQPPEVRQV